MITCEDKSWGNVPCINALIKLSSIDVCEAPSSSWRLPEMLKLHDYQFY